MIEAVPDRLEGAPRRVRREWSEAFKVQLVAETFVQGANVSAIARREGIAPSQLFGWRRQAIRNGTVTPPATEEGPHFIEVDTAVSSVIEIALEGAVVRVGSDVPEAHLQRVIRALRSA